MDGDDRRQDNLLRTVMTDPEMLHSEPTGQLMGSLLVIAGAPADVGTHVVIEDEVVVGRMTTGLQLRDEAVEGGGEQLAGERRPAHRLWLQQAQRALRRGRPRKLR